MTIEYFIILWLYVCGAQASVMFKVASDLAFHGSVKTTHGKLILIWIFWPMLMAGEAYNVVASHFKRGDG